MSDSVAPEEIHRITDWEAAGDFEKKHTPNAAAVREGEKVRVNVTIGHGIGHPNQEDHYIEWIQILVDGTTAYSAAFAPVVVDPTAECLLLVEEGATITALASCNLHGVWAFDVTAP